MIYKEKGNHFFDDYGMDYILSQNLLVDGKRGGGILGNSHENGGVKVVGLTNRERILISVEVEGFEFFMNCKSSNLHRDRLEEINSDMDINFDIALAYRKHESIPIIDARPIEVGGVLTSRLIGMECNHHFIVNKFSTAKYLKELIELNK